MNEKLAHLATHFLRALHLARARNSPKAAFYEDCWRRADALLTVRLRRGM